MSTAVAPLRETSSDGELLSFLHFDPVQGTVLREPKGRGYGYWVGGHKAVYDEEADEFYLFYRDRSPLEKGRGGECAVAVSSDGQRFRDVWSAEKIELRASSIEVGSPVITPEGNFRLYLSYEYGPTGEWRIDVLEAKAPEMLKVQSRRTVVRPTDFGLDFVKDPVALLVDGKYRLYAAVSPRERFVAPDPRVRCTVGHESTMLFESSDGLVFTSGRFVFEPGGQPWEQHKARINSVFSLGEDTVAFYDGARSTYDMYEEACGVARTSDGVVFDRLPLEEPLVSSPHGCVRYAQGLVAKGKLYVFYEYCRPDGSHDLRVSIKELP